MEVLIENSDEKYWKGKILECLELQRGQVRLRKKEKKILEIIKLEENTRITQKQTWAGVTKKWREGPPVEYKVDTVYKERLL